MNRALVRLLYLPRLLLALALQNEMSSYTPPFKKTTLPSIKRVSVILVDTKLIGQVQFLALQIPEYHALFCLRLTAKYEIITRLLKRTLSN